MHPEPLYRSPNPLAPYYSHFRVGERLLLTGHSHQAWPDCGLVAQNQAWLDAATHVDNKWEQAFARAEQVRAGFGRLIEDEAGVIALGQNTHELVVRLLSALPLRQRPRIVSTDGEFHTLRRQLDRLAEEHLEIIKEPALPAATLAERLAARVDNRTAVVMVSAVLFQNAHIVPGLDGLFPVCRDAGAALLVDAYHAVNVAPFSVQRLGLQQAFVVGGGYKYCQLGEGNCFLRFPGDCELRPVITGWFSEFSALAAPTGRITYGRGPDRFAGATYDPTSHYRAAAVFGFFQEQGLSPGLLRQVSQHQVGLMAALFDKMDANPALIRRDGTVAVSDLAGFLALQSPHAEQISQRLAQRGVATDFRGDSLRLGPAPYLSDLQLENAMAVLGQCIQDIEHGR